MKRWSARQLFVLFLAVFVTVGMSLSFVQAGDMTAKMAMAADMSASGHDGCQGCPGGSRDDDMKTMACAGVCVAPVMAVLPQAAPVRAVQKPASIATHYPLLHGRASSPDPYPPRTTDMG